MADALVLSASASKKLHSSEKHIIASRSLIDRSENPGAFLQSQSIGFIAYKVAITGAGHRVRVNGFVVQLFFAFF